MSAISFENDKKSKSCPLSYIRAPPILYSVLQGEMYNKVKVDDSFWTLEDGKEISIALQKVNKGRTTKVSGYSRARNSWLGNRTWRRSCETLTKSGLMQGLVWCGCG